MAEEKKTKDVVLCGASAYVEKYYLNELFSGLPEAVKNELKAACVLYTEAAGGIITLRFTEDGRLIIETAADDYDYYYDEIEAGIQATRLRDEKQELFSQLELYYRVKFLGETFEA